MTEQNSEAVNTKQVKKMLDKRRAKMTLSLKVCAHCSLCAESCFLFNSNNKDPRYMPSFKVINSIGRLYKKRGKVKRSALEEIRETVWEDCALCTRCYCPFGIDLPDMLAFARNICRSQGVSPDYEK